LKTNSKDFLNHSVAKNDNNLGIKKLMNSKSYFNFLVIFIFILNFSCKQEKPVADFEYRVENKYFPINVSFTNRSETAIKYFWDFGDLGTSTETSPRHSYLTDQEYNVTLTAYNGDASKSIVKKIQLRLYPSILKITSIELDSINFISSTGLPYDPSDGPDVFTYVNDGYSNELYSTINNIHHNASPNDLPIIWSNPSPYIFDLYQLEQKRNELQFLISDYDSLGYNESMDQATFSLEDLFQYKNISLPSDTILVGYNGLKLKLYLNWE
jgi:hypothetical protein